MHLLNAFSFCSDQFFNIKQFALVCKCQQLATCSGFRIKLSEEAEGSWQHNADITICYNHLGYAHMD